MAGDNAQVKVRLVVDSNSAKIAHDMKRDMTQVDKAAHHAGAQAGASLGGGLKAGAIAMGNIYAELAKQALHFGKEALMGPINAFLEGDKVIRQFVGSFALVDKAGTSMENLRQLSLEVKGELTAMGIAAGVADTQLFETFEGIISRGGKSVEQAKALTKEIAYAGKAIPGGPAALGQAFEQIQLGMVRAKNPIAAMIAATGQMKGSAKDVALAMSKMSIEKQMELAEKAVGRMGEKMKKVPLTFSEALTSLSVLKGDLLEEAGKAMAPGIGKTVDKIRSAFVTAEGENTQLTKDLYKAAADFGNFMSDAFELGREFVNGFGDGLSVANDEFRIIWREVFGESDVTFKNMVEYMHAAGAILGGALKMFATGVGAIIYLVDTAVKSMLRAVGLVAETLGRIPGLGDDGKLGLSLQAAAASSDQEGRLAKLGRTGTSPEETARLRKQFTETATATGEGGDVSAQLAAADAKRAEAENAITIARGAENDANARLYFESYKRAKDLGDSAAQDNIAAFLKNNAKMAEAVGKLGPDIIGDARASFVEALEKAGGADAAKAFKDASKIKIDTAGAKINQTFTGGIHVKQDFKDQDPDRVLVLFKQKLTSAGTSRIMARTSSPFGG